MIHRMIPKKTRWEPPRLARGVARRGGLVVTTLTLTALVLSGCNAASSPSGALSVVGAENQYANVAAQVGGRYVHATAIMSNPNVDPHTFEVSTSVAQAVAQARIVIQNGLGYDQFMNQLEAASPSSSRVVISAQRLLGLSSATRNPHLWYRPSTMLRVADAVERALARAEPSHRAYFARRLTRFDQAVGAVSASVASLRARFAGRVVASTEPVADYLLAAVGVVNATPWRFQADVMNGVDPSPEDVAHLRTLIQGHRVAALLYNAQVTSSVTVALRELAVSSGVPVVAVYETMPAPGYDYQSWMLAQLAALARALGTHRSTEAL